MVTPKASLFPCKYAYESQECAELLVFRIFFPQSFEYIDIMISCTRGVYIRKFLANLLGEWGGGQRRSRCRTTTPAAQTILVTIIF